MSAIGKPRSHAPAPELAYETIHYAVACLMFNRAHALEVINQEDNGLNKEQREAIAKKISELKAPPKTVRDTNRLENRLIEVLQPSTMKALKDPKIVAEVLYFVLNTPAGESASITFKIFDPKNEFPKCLTRRELVDRKALSEVEIADKLEILYGRSIFGSFGWSTGKIQELLEQTPQFAQLNITAYWVPFDFVERIGNAIAECKNTKFRRIFEKELSLLSRAEFYAVFPYLREFRASSSMHVNDYANDVVEVFTVFPNLEKLESRIWGNERNRLSVFENRGLTSLKLNIDLQDNEILTRENIETLKKLPLEGLNLRGSQGIRDEELLMLAELPSLKELDLTLCIRISVPGIAAFLRASSTIKKVKLEKYYFNFENGNVFSLTDEEILSLQAQFPHIDFADRARGDDPWH